jgi:hypothetical protein
MKGRGTRRIGYIEKNDEKDRNDEITGPYIGSLFHPDHEITQEGD